MDPGDAFRCIDWSGRRYSIVLIETSYHKYHPEQAFQKQRSQTLLAEAAPMGQRPPSLASGDSLSGRHSRCLWDAA